MNHTTNYNLNQWEAGDTITREDFNADNAAIDSAIKAVADAVAGGLRIVTGSYYGTGSGTSRLSFDFTPQAVMIASSTESGFGIMLRPCGVMSQPNLTSYKTTVTWAAKAVSWSNSDSVSLQFNGNNVRYYWLAIG